MKIAVSGKLGALVAACLLVCGQPILAVEKAPASILSPKRDEVVESAYEIVGRINIPGQALVLIRPDVPGGEWYPQPAVETNDRGLFKTKLRFGNDKTASGTKFQIAIVVLTSADEAALFRGKESLPIVPESIAHSEVIPVVLGKAKPEKATGAKTPAEPAPVASAITFPTADVKVKTVTEVTGRLSSEGWPVVIVRSDDANDMWWVQGQAKFSEGGAFTSSARFGNEKTPSGRKFHVAILTFASAKAAEKYVTGVSFATPPPGARLSEEIVVVLEASNGK